MIYYFKEQSVNRSSLVYRMCYKMQTISRDLDKSNCDDLSSTSTHCNSFLSQGCNYKKIFTRARQERIFTTIWFVLCWILAQGIWSLKSLTIHRIRQMELVLFKKENPTSKDCAAINCSKISKSNFNEIAARTFLVVASTTFAVAISSCLSLLNASWRCCCFALRCLQFSKLESCSGIWYTNCRLWYLIPSGLSRCGTFSAGRLFM